MKCKYKKFLKAAYIDYGDDYCGYGSGTFAKPAVATPIIVITGTTAIIACATSGATIYYTLDDFKSYMNNLGFKWIVYYIFATPTTELVNAPQIEEAESYTCEISQGGKAISWSSFTTE